MATTDKPCKNAGTDPAHLKRPATAPGPKCATCHRAAKKAASRRAHGLRVAKTYGLTEDEYWALYEAQDGRCAICRRATGRTKRLACDHDHACCSGPISCGACVRGLICGPCNSALAHFRDDPEAFERAAGYLRTPPAQPTLARYRTTRPPPGVD